ncbi:Dual specificity protein phosphatase 16 [Galemys pyrenaicus]|uniref:Dual specificity protein phosphatase 16 n=1 Tax=Galemys pyrenaicus TaxID=202257 RepID=A0A8J6DJ47_GALPY|nr:Dual specificity protein phosphatase 16 [Galemys pyrenaicus]
MMLPIYARVPTQVCPLAHAHPGMLAAPQVSIISEYNTSHILEVMELELLEADEVMATLVALLSFPIVFLTSVKENPLPSLCISQHCLTLTNTDSTQTLFKLCLGCQCDVLTKTGYVLNASNTYPKPTFIPKYHFLSMNDNFTKMVMLDKTVAFIEKAKASNGYIPVNYLPQVTALGKLNVPVSAVEEGGKKSEVPFSPPYSNSTTSATAGQSIQPPLLEDSSQVLAQVLNALHLPSEEWKHKEAPHEVYSGLVLQAWYSDILASQISTLALTSSWYFAMDSSCFSSSSIYGGCASYLTCSNSPPATISLTFPCERCQTHAEDITEPSVTAGDDDLVALHENLALQQGQEVLYQESENGGRA